MSGQQERDYWFDCWMEYLEEDAVSMFKNITDDKVDFYCDNRMAAIEDLDFVLTELKKMTNHGHSSARFEKLLSELIKRFEEEDND